MFSAGIPLMSALDRSPNMEDQPRLSILTIAMRVLPFSNTTALANKSPCFSFDGLGFPIPPDTGNRGLGVSIRRDAPTLNACAFNKGAKNKSPIQQLIFINL